MATGGGGRGDEMNASRMSRNADITEEPLTFLAPIVGYEEKPLVSLEEAVKELVPVLPTIQSQAYVAKQRCQDPADGLSPDESASIMLYTMTWEPLDKCLYIALNDVLRSANRSQKLKPWFLYLRLFLNALFRLPPLHETIHRGVRLDMSAKYIKEKTIVWWGFSSCTKNVEVLQSREFLGKKGARTLFNIQCETARDIRKHSYFPTEDEVLLLAATQFKVTACLDQGDLCIVYLKETRPPHPLLQPVPLISQTNATSPAAANVYSNNKDLNKTALNETVSIDSKHNQTTGVYPTHASEKSNDQPINDKTYDDRTIQSWLDLQFHDNGKTQMKKPNEIEDDIPQPPDPIDENILDRIQGSMIGLALGDALGAHVEFRPHNYLVANPVTDLEGGGTWGLQKGQFTDETSTALCLANSLVVYHGFVPYDQLVRYKWWYKHGYMSSTGQCFDIGHATRQSIMEFERRQRKFANEQNITIEEADYLSDRATPEKFDVYCSEEDVAGNGPLGRLAPVPLFFYRYPEEAVEFSGQSGQITHGDVKAYDACRFYGALIVAALQGYTKDELLDKNFYSNHQKWFGATELHPDIKSIAEGSYKKKKDYAGGIRGKGYIVDALEAALWAFWSVEGSFEKGALAAVNLGDDTDTTAAIYGQLAGAYYGYKSLPKNWLDHLDAHKFMKKISKWIAYEGQRWQKTEEMSVDE